MTSRKAKRPATEVSEPLVDEFPGEEASSNSETPESTQAVSLGDILRAAKEESGLGLGDLTVLSAVNDPFRLDTPANHVNGKWLYDQMEACGLLARANPIHNRGIHYAIVARGGVKLPSGKPYKNDADCWAFLEDRASKAARWLGYVPFE